MLPIVVITVLSLGGSFFCSLLEACIYSVNRSRIESLRQTGHPAGVRLARLRANIDEAIAAILILNTVANSAGAAVAGALVSEHFGGGLFLGLISAVGLYAIFFTTGILFFSEIVPKSLGVKFADRLAPSLSLPLTWIITLLYPMVKACVAVTRLWGKESMLHHATEEDIINLAMLGQRAGQIHAQEARWVANALRLNDVTAYDLMTPKTVVARVPASLSLKDTRIDAQHWRFSRLPVCDDENPEDIVGVVYRARVFDALARDQFELTMKDLMGRPHFVDENIAAHRLLERFLSRRIHLFCVRSESGGFSGVVTLEDVLECLLGAEIVDESDLHEDMQEVARQRRRRLLQQSRRLIDGEARARRAGASEDSAASG